MRVGIITVQLLERVSDPAMKLHAPGATEFLVQGVSDQDVGEAHTECAGRGLCDHSFADCLVEEVEQVIGAAVGHVADVVQGELA